MASVCDQALWQLLGWNGEDLKEGGTNSKFEATAVVHWSIFHEGPVHTTIVKVFH